MHADQKDQVSEFAVVDPLRKTVLPGQVSLNVQFQLEGLQFQRGQVQEAKVDGLELRVRVKVFLYQRDGQV